MAESDSSWEDHSVTEEVSGDDSSSDSSYSGSDSSNFSSPVPDPADDEVEDQQDEDEEVRGAEPYRFEPIAPAGQGQGGEDDDEEEANLDNDRLLNTDWCTCGHCIMQPNISNCICCKEVDAICTKMTDLRINLDAQDQCISQHEWFEACCLHPAVLHTAHLQYQAQYGRRGVQGTVDQKFRHVAYRQVVRWCWGYLGRFNRVPLPSCVMNKIRQTYPNPDGTYKGFSYPELD